MASEPQVFESFEQYQQRFGRIMADGTTSPTPTGSAEHGRAFARSFLKELGESLAKSALKGQVGRTKKDG